MFNAKQTKSSRKLSLISTGITALAFAVTFGFAAIANAEIKASVSKPALRSEYKGTDSISLDSNLNLARGNQKINVSLRDSDLKQALRMIADKAGLNIIFHSSVDGKITLDLVNVTLNDAFKMILQASDMSFFLDKGTLVVMSKENSLTSDIGKQNMMVIPVKYADSSKVADFLNSNIFSTNRPGLSNNKIVVTNPVTNELIIFGTDNDYKMAQKIISKLDVAPQTISFRVNHTTPKEMATLICQSLFPTATMGSSGSGSGGAVGASGSGGGADTSGGAVTGGASGSGGSGGASSGAGGASSGGSGGAASGSDDISLGEGKIACAIKGNVTANKLASLSGTSLTVTYFPQKGTINVTGGSESQAEMVKSFIKSNDKKQPQAYMEMQIVELNEEGSKDFSNTWTVWSPFFSGTFGKSGLSNRDSYPSYFMGRPITVVEVGGEPGAAPKILEYNNRYHGPVSVGWSIDYLIKNGKGRLLANPKVIVTNGKKSLINLTSDYIKTTEEEMLSGTGTTGTVMPIQRTYEIGDDMGISVEMVPFISPDGYVTLNLKPHYATQKGAPIMSPSSSGGDIIAATLLQRRDMELSNVRIKDGETLVLGGLINEQETKSVIKMPFLGDLPIIGSVFRSTNTTNTKSELVIMLTPRIIKDTEDMASENENL